ncbi:MAG TPA: PDZ domain-containing protein [Thermoanaerobaculaceae bacterium]|nr:PDZ domain-containing protein [Thermoanaerobaculaceae bacterium]
MPRVLTALSVALLAGSAAVADAAIDARLMRQPAVSATQIAFVYAGDIWVAPKAGGVADRLSTPLGEEQFPRFSPDGTQIGYSADYDGNLDLYVIPAQGGLPRRITHHPAADRMLGWYPDGKSILFATSMTSGRDRFDQLYKVSAQGGLPEKLPVPYGEFGAISADGTQLAYMPESLDFRTWKRYRGGWAPDIWLFDLVKLTARNLTNNPANDAQPMWHGSTLYFLSDRDDVKRNNIWALDLATGKTREVTHFTDYDVRFPSIGPSDIVFEDGENLYLLDLATEKVHAVKIEVVTDRATLKPREENVSKLIQDASVSPSGKRALFEARGDVFSVPAEHGPVYDLTRTSGIAERFPTWSPDGKTVAYFSDRSGEYELTVRPADGSGEERKVTSLGPGFRYRPYWSPDSKKVAFIDKAMVISICDLATGKVTPIDRGLHMFEGSLEQFSVSWSADSRWLAYAHDLANRNDAVFLYDTKDAKLHQVTDGFYWTSAPVFDPDGKYLYVLTNRTFTPSYSDFDNTWIYSNATDLAAITLRKDVASPLAPRDDVEGKEAKKDGDKPKADGKKDEAKKEEGKSAAAADKGKEGAKAGEDKKEPPKPVEIDLDGLAERLVVLPPHAGNYDRLEAVSGKVLYRRQPRTGDADPKAEKTPVVYWDLEEREEKTVVADVDGYLVAADGKKLLVWKKDAYSIVDVKPDQKTEKKLPTGDLEMTVDPPAEWRQIFTDAWRFERDYFYDPNLHGEDWNAMRVRYGKLLDDAVTRWDVNFVIGELIAELNSSHTYRGGGDLEKPLQRGVGLLGCDFRLEGGAYRISHIVRGAPWDSEVRSPLDEPGVDVKEGDYLLAVNHVPLDVTQDPWAAFQGLAEKDVLLTVNSKPGAEGARDVLVKTLGDEDRLRYLEWVNQKRLMVDKATGGKVGYVYVPDTGRGGQTELVRQFLGQFDKEGLVIDERFNSGGQIPDRFVELLNRPVYSYWAVRDGKDWQWPPFAHFGPEVMLINGWSGSGGDCFPLYFRQAGRGPLIGMRTWGGLIGISGVPTLIDGGAVTVPTFGIYSPDGKWIVEGHGVDPDIEVVDDPAKMVNGGDPQLERAIEEVGRLLKAHPAAVPKRPAYENRAGH